MDKILEGFGNQLTWEPKMEHEEHLVRAPRLIVCGMGGSRLAGDLVRSALPARDITVHADFGSPPHIGNDTLFVISSYSGNTEEALDAFRAVREERKHIAVVAGGGTLLEEARRAKIPTVEIPEHGLPPRLAIGYSVKALLAFIGEERALAQMTAILLPDSLAAEGNTLAERLKDAIPLIYTSRRMGGLAYYWKVVLNETAKLHAFANVFPEAGHNEIEGFSAGGGRASGAEASRFACITLTDPEDDPRVRQRLALFSRTCREKEIPIVPLSLSGANVWERMFRSVVLANWTAYHLARARDVNPLATPLIEAWKRELRG